EGLRCKPWECDHSGLADLGGEEPVEQRRCCGTAGSFVRGFQLDTPSISGLLASSVDSFVGIANLRLLRASRTIRTSSPTVKRPMNALYGFDRRIGQPKNGPPYEVWYSNPRKASLFTSQKPIIPLPERSTSVQPLLSRSIRPGSLESGSTGSLAGKHTSG